MRIFFFLIFPSSSSHTHLCAKKKNKNELIVYSVYIHHGHMVSSQKITILNYVTFSIYRIVFLMRSGFKSMRIYRWKWLNDILKSKPESAAACSTDCMTNHPLHWKIGLHISLCEPFGGFFFLFFCLNTAKSFGAPFFLSLLIHSHSSAGEIIILKTDHKQSSFIQQSTSAAHHDRVHLSLSGSQHYLNIEIFILFFPDGLSFTIRHCCGMQNNCVSQSNRDTVCMRSIFFFFSFLRSVFRHRLSVSILFRFVYREQYSFFFLSCCGYCVCVCIKRHNWKIVCS